MNIAPPDRRAILAGLEETFTWRTAGRELTLVAPRSAEAVLEAMPEGDDIPFWAQLWDSAYGLCRYLESLDPVSRDSISTGNPRRLLELGCGVGAVGCVAAALGWQVTLMDYSAEALEYARRNLSQNGLCGELIQSDWREFRLPGQFDLVVGSDILYDPDFHGDLAVVLDEARRSGAAIALADPGRQTALAFAAAREKAGWPIQLEFRAGPRVSIAIYRCGPLVESFPPQDDQPSEAHVQWLIGSHAVKERSEYGSKPATPDR